jgi:hypothetical protein
MMKMKRTYPAAAMGVAALVGGIFAAVPANAGGGDFTEEEGACSGNATGSNASQPTGAAGSSGSSG